MRTRAGLWLNIALVLVAAGCLGWLSAHYGLVSDWTAGSRASIAPSSQKLLQQLPGEIKVTSYTSPSSKLRPLVAAFIARYQRFKPDITLSFVDPAADPAAMRKLGIQVDGEIIIAWQGHSRHLTQLSDTAFVNTLARLARGGEHLVAFVTGHGERHANGQANFDLGQFMATLERRGVRALPLNFAQVGQVPQNTDLVVLASPLVPLGTGAVQALVSYVEGGGNLLWLAEPDPRNFGLTPLAEALGVTFLPGMLVDASGTKLGLSDPRNVVVGNYPDHPIVAQLGLITLFPQVAALAQLGSSEWTVQPILTSSPSSWNERQPIERAATSTIQYDPDADELRGPLDFGFALTRLSPAPGKQQQRVVVIGDGDFLSNSFLGNGGNAALGRHVFNWLLGADQLVKIPPSPAPDRHLAVSQSTLAVLVWGLLVALPLVLLLWTGLAFWRRRRR